MSLAGHIKKRPSDNVGTLWSRVSNKECRQTLTCYRDQILIQIHRICILPYRIFIFTCFTTTFFIRFNTNGHNTVAGNAECNNRTDYRREYHGRNYPAHVGPVLVPAPIYSSSLSREVSARIGRFAIRMASDSPLSHSLSLTRGAYCTDAGKGGAICDFSDTSGQ